MQSGVKPKATDDPHDFVVVPSDQVQVAPSDAEITDLLRAAARHQSEAVSRTPSDSSAPSSVPSVDTTFRATDVNADVPARSSFTRRAMRAVAALLLTIGVGAAALSWQTFSYAGKKALLSWAPKWAIAASLPLEKLGLGKNSTPSDEPADAPPVEAAAPAQSAVDNTASSNTAPSSAALSSVAPPPSDPAQQLQSMARDLANANQQVETLKASIAELKASQQQMARELANKLAEQNAKAKIAAAPRPAPAAHRPAPVYSSTGYAASPTQAAPSPAYRPTTAPYSAQASAAAPPPPAAAQPYAPPPVQIQQQADPGVVGLAPRPPMPLSQ